MAKLTKQDTETLKHALNEARGKWEQSARNLAVIARSARGEDKIVASRKLGARKRLLRELEAVITKLDLPV